MAASPPDARLSAWVDPESVRCTPLDGGLINRTWRVDPRDGGPPIGVLQRVNGYVFKPRVNDDLDRVTTHLASKGLPTPRLVPARDGARWLHGEGDTSWRMLTWLPGDCFAVLPSHEHARDAGALVGRWHAATADLAPEFANIRPGAHDTDAHLDHAVRALDTFPDHPLRDAVAPLIEHLGARWEAVRPLLPHDLPERVIHGDLKATNVRFGPDGSARALLDLDTCAASTLDIELGDMLRSWCATGLEDDVTLSVDAERFSATLTGYAQGSRDAPPSEAEWASLVPGTIRISTELGLRFAGDVLHEAYFGYDADRFSRAGEHHLLRTRGQASLSDALWATRDDLRRRLDAARRTLETT